MRSVKDVLACNFRGVVLLVSEIRLATKGTHSFRQYLRSLWFHYTKWKDDPTYFYPEGIWVFCGSQGSGKTLSAVQTVQKLCARYPMARVVSNLQIQGIPQTVEPFTDYEQLEKVKNGTQGVIFFIDEIHVLWNSLESKDIPISEMAIFAQNRKDRRVIIGTSQVYGRIAKPIREQLKYLVLCKTFLKSVTKLDVCDPTEEIEKDGHISPSCLFTRWFFHTPELYRSFDTLTKIERIKRKEKQRGYVKRY